jgi:hypothetical protein
MARLDFFGLLILFSFTAGFGAIGLRFAFYSDNIVISQRVYR